MTEPQSALETKLSDSDLQAIRDAVSEQLQLQFAKGCLCGLKPNALQEMGHFWGMMEDVSGGEPSKSVEVLRSVIRNQQRIEMASSKFMMAVVTTAAIAAFYGAISGVKAIICFFKG